MSWFTTSARPGSALRTRLRLESLDARALPSSLIGDDPAPPDPPGGGSIVNPPPGITAPRIIDFIGVAVADGWYTFTGRVEADTSPAGLSVLFGGIPSLGAQMVTIASDGTFSLYIHLQTNGSDDGTATAQTTVNGQQSNLAEYDVTPSA